MTVDATPRINRSHVILASDTLICAREAKATVVIIPPHAVYAAGVEITPVMLGSLVPSPAITNHIPIMISETEIAWNSRAKKVAITSVIRASVTTKNASIGESSRKFLHLEADIH